MRGHFPDGQLYVNLHGHSAASLPSLRPIQASARIFQALGLPAEQIPVDIEAAAGIYRSLLADRRMLVLLDNARDAEQVRPLLPGSPACLVLVTSRDRMSGLVAHEGIGRLTLDVLAPDEAMALMVRLLGRRRVHAEADAAAALAGACARLPLALRVAMANLLSHPHISIAEYLARLQGDNRLAADHLEPVERRIGDSRRPVEPDPRRCRMSTSGEGRASRCPPFTLGKVTQPVGSEGFASMEDPTTARTAGMTRKAAGMTTKSVLAGLAVAATAATALAIGQGLAYVAVGAPAVVVSAVTDSGPLSPGGDMLAAVSKSKKRGFTLRIGGAEAAGFFKEATG